MEELAKKGHLVGLENVIILNHHHVTRLDVVLDFGYHYIRI